MKYISKLFITLLLLPFLGACVDDDIAKRGHDIEEGIPVKVSLKFGVSKSKLVTRSAQDDIQEQTVNSLFAIAFFANGDLSGYASYTNLNNTNGSGTINDFPMHSGSGQKIFLIANPGTGMGTLTMEELKLFGEAGKTFDDFKQLHSSFLHAEDVGTNVERMLFLMFGQMEDENGTAAMDVETDGTISNYKGPVELNRVDARITFKIKVDPAEGLTEMVFKPRYYQVNRVPAGTYIYPQETDYTAAGYQDMRSETVSITKNFDATEADDMGFDFYLLENRLSPTVSITSAMKGVAENLYALREKRESVNSDKTFDKEGQEYELGDYVYAPADAAYVVITGELVYKNQEDNNVYANVSYTVHLGSTGNSSTREWYNNEALVNNYDTERNVHYVYTVTLQGVNSIKVEVEDDKEERPGVEGDVVVAEGEVEDMDAHYDRDHFTLKRSAIKAGLSWAINTPFQKGIKVFNADRYLINGRVPTDETSYTTEQLKMLQTDLSLNDYKWVQFVINAENTKYGDYGRGEQVPNNEFAKYPGHLAYSGNGGNEDQPAPAFGGNGYHWTEWTAYYTKDVKMYDVNQLLNHLYIEANNPDSELFYTGNTVDKNVNSTTSEVTITAFVDEYVYIYDPTKVYYRAPNTKGLSEEDLALWKKVVNGDNRLLHICQEGAQYSPDGNSSWANSVKTFSQRPIYTFYNPNAEGLVSAWGTESKNETGRLHIGSPSLSTKHDNTASNGRENTLNIVRNSLRWSNVLNIALRYGELKSGYNNIWYACLGRNRDLDGDDIVDEDEIRWYLASIDQLTDLWIGEEAVPNATLYDITENVTEGGTTNGSRGTVKRSHVASSSYFTGASNPWIIWAEEGASRGSSNDDNGNDYSDYEGKLYDYRCIRNLGLDLEDIAKVPDDYVEPSITQNEYILTVSRLSSEARRSALSSGYLPRNNERSYNNRPYRSFAVLRNNYYPIGDFVDWVSLYDNEPRNGKCPDGYRIPNQRELMLLYTTYPELFSDFSDVQYMAKTEFSFRDYSPYYKINDEGQQIDIRYGFAYDPNNLYLLTGNSTVIKVRCVRDVTD